MSSLATDETPEASQRALLGATAKILLHIGIAISNIVNIMNIVATINAVTTIATVTVLIVVATSARLEKHQDLVSSHLLVPRPKMSILEHSFPDIPECSAEAFPF